MKVDGSREGAPLLPQSSAAASATEAVTVPILGVDRVSKDFEGTRAVDDVSFTVASGEIVALVGHNGSGKSTLVKMITGYHRPDRGRIVFGERELKPTERPIAVMHQDLGLVHSLSVLDNLRIGRYRTGVGGRIRWRAEREDAAETLRAFGCAFGPDDAVSQLAQGDQATVALLRALESLQDPRRGLKSGVLLLDEPTASLASQEVLQVLNAVRGVRARGFSILVVTHHLHEVIEVADRVLVMRNGALVMDSHTGHFTENTIVEAMVGGGGVVGAPVVGDPPLHAPGRSKPTGAPPVLSVENLRGGTVSDVSFDVWAGEVVGLAGLAGSGNTEVPYLVSGGRRRRGGTVVVEGSRLPPGKPAFAKDKGVALVPSDRQRQGGVMSMSVAWNISLPRMGELSRYGHVDSAIERTLVERVMRLFRIVPMAPDLPLRSLSGGNQQRALVGRWLDARPPVLLLDDPCAGVDVVSRQEILSALRRAARHGMAVVMASSQDDELAEVCTRVLVLSKGTVTKELRGSEISVEQIGRDCLATSIH